MDEWAVQILVLLSFTLQVLLLVLGAIRRRNVSLVPRMLLWLAYQPADSTALFTLGHLSLSSRLRGHQLVAFWAPFLLVHLGGQDTITAYSFEDNRLWLRHLQTLLVQVSGAAYVLYKYIPGSKALILATAFLMFVVGVLKYGERIWALKSASIDSIWSSLKKSYGNDSQQPQASLEQVGVGGGHRLDPAEKVLMGAHSLLHVCKGLFVGLRREQSEHVRQVILSFRESQSLDKLMEMELSLMYDIMYTKSAVIHTWYGCCIRIVSLLFTVMALLLFQFSSKGGQKTGDIAITYALLLGALLVEFASLLRAAVSTWTYEFLSVRRWHRLHDVVRSLRRLLRAESYRSWSGSVGQYNLFWSCAHERMELTERMARMMGLEELWNQVRYHSEVADSTTRELVLKEVLEMGDMQLLRGEFFSLSRALCEGHTLGSDENAGFNIEDIDFEGSIITWHIATEICLFEDYCTLDARWVSLAKAIKVLSNYMMHLLVVRPYMLPGTVLHSRYLQTRDYLWSIMRPGVAEGDTAQDRLKSALRKECSTLFNLGARSNHHGRPPPFISGVYFAMLLLSDEGNDMGERLRTLFRAWVEMLSYVGDNCNREYHARELSTGGEFVTIVWLMRGHVKLAGNPNPTPR